VSSVLPGTGWAEDPATADTAVARSPEDVRLLAAGAADLKELCARTSVCRACPRLVSWREQAAVNKRRAYADETYWGRPIAGWGSEEPAILIVGLAPAAHGGNRTGRIFTGDRSGDWLFASLHRVGLAALPTSTHAGDGQRLLGARMVATVRCAPPDNKPTPAERAACFPWLAREVAEVAASLKVIVALGGYAWQGMWPALKEAGYVLPRPRPPFAHGAELTLTRGVSRTSSQRGAGNATSQREVVVLGCYHPSQQNTFTGRVTEGMLDAVFARAVEHARG